MQLNYFVVFLQVTPHAPRPDPSEGTSICWTCLTTLANKKPRWSFVTVDIASRLAPKNSALLRVVMRTLIGSMQFSAIILNSDNKHSAAGDLPPVLWGLTLGMTLDLLAYMNSPPLAHVDVNLILPRKASPSMRSVRDIFVMITFVVAE